MNKLKYLFLASIAALSLTGCGSSSTAGATLPSGGKAIDTTTEKGKIEVKQKLSANIQETIKGLSSVKITNTLNNTNLSAKVSTTGLEKSPINGVTFKDINATLNVKNLNAKAEYQLLGLDKTYADLQGIASLNFNGGVSFEGNLPDLSNYTVADKSATINNKKYSYSVNAKDVDLLAYYKDNTLYGDFSDDGLYSFVKDLDTTTKKVVEDFPLLSTYIGNVNLLDVFNELFGTTKKVSFDFTSLIGEEVSEKILPEISDETVENLEESITEFLTYLETLNKTFGFNLFTFKKYDDGRFGLSYSLNKDQFINLIMGTFNTFYVGSDSQNGQSSATSAESSIKKELSDAIQKFEVKGAILFNEKGLLTKYGMSENIKVKTSYPIKVESSEVITKADIVLDFSTGSTFAIDYNQAIQLPSDLSGYTPLKLYA